MQATGAAGAVAAWPRFLRAVCAEAGVAGAGATAESVRLRSGLVLARALTLPVARGPDRQGKLFVSLVHHAVDSGVLDIEITVLMERETHGAAAGFWQRVLTREDVVRHLEEEVGLQGELEEHAPLFARALEQVTLENLPTLGGGGEEEEEQEKEEEEKNGQEGERDGVQLTLPYGSHIEASLSLPAVQMDVHPLVFRFLDQQIHDPRMLPGTRWLVTSTAGGGRTGMTGASGAAGAAAGGGAGAGGAAAGARKKRKVNKNPLAGGRKRRLTTKKK